MTFKNYEHTTTPTPDLESLAPKRSGIPAQSAPRPVQRFETSSRFHHGIAQAKCVPTQPSPIYCNSMASRPAGRGWPKYGRIVLEGGKSRKRRKRSISHQWQYPGHVSKQRQPWPQNPRRPLQRRRLRRRPMSRRHRKKLRLYIARTTHCKGRTTSPRRNDLTSTRTRADKSAFSTTGHCRLLLIFPSLIHDRDTSPREFLIATGLCLAAGLSMWSEGRQGALH